MTMEYLPEQFRSGKTLPSPAFAKEGHVDPLLPPLREREMAAGRHSSVGVRKSGPLNSYMYEFHLKSPPV